MFVKSGAAEPTARFKSLITASRGVLGLILALSFTLLLLFSWRNESDCWVCNLGDLLSSPASLADSVQPANVLVHLRALEAIAMQHSNHSRSVLNAYNQSAQYVIEQLRRHTDCVMTIQPLKVPVWEEYSPSQFLLRGIGGSSVDGALTLQPLVDHRLMRYGGVSTRLSGARVRRIVGDGCNRNDYRYFIAGEVALIDNDPKSLGNCSLYNAALLAEDAKASAVLFANPSSRTVLPNSRIRSLHWTTADRLVRIPVLAVSHSIGELLKQQSDRLTVDLNTFATLTIADTFNILCDTREGDPESVIMMGAHLDSVPEGPGLVDNASGSASILEVFLAMYRIDWQRAKLVNKVRFAWWAAEELGLMGSRHYCRELNRQELKRIVFYSNHDMLASPNYIPYIHDGNSAPESLRERSVRIQQMYQQYFDNRVPRDSRIKHYALDGMSGGSDYFSFLEVGIPAGGLATGASSIKSVEERSRHGGLANAQLDPCYHQRCDDFANIAQDVLSVMVKSIGGVLEQAGGNENLREWMAY